MAVLETATLLFGIGLSSAAVSDAPIGTMTECKAYLQVQAKRYEIFLKPNSVQLEIKYRKLGSDFTVTRTCIDT